MRRLAVVLLLTVLALVVATPSALAAPPTHERVPVDVHFVDESSCGFPIEIRQTGFVIAIDWVDENGVSRHFEAAPQLKTTLTNLDTGESIRIIIAGPVHITESPDGSLTVVGTGNWLFHNNPKTDEPGLFRTSGHFVFSIDAQGNESFQFTGHVIDLCAELAA
jgi:hypothetical protein